MDKVKNNMIKTVEMTHSEKQFNHTSIPSCSTCYYSKNGKTTCDRHLNKIKPDYSKGVECAYNNYAHYRPFNIKIDILE